MALIIDGEYILENKKQSLKTIDTSMLPRDGMTEIHQATELGEAFGELNDDTIDPDTGMSAIDLRTRLHPIEIAGILAWDSLVALDVIPNEGLIFTRQKKRLAISESGKSREEMVRIAAGQREQEQGLGMKDRLLSKLGLNNGGAR